MLDHQAKLASIAAMPGANSTRSASHCADGAVSEAVATVYSVYMPNIDIVVTGSAAKAVFQAILTGRGTGGEAGGILPEALGAYNFEVLLNQEDGQWKVTSAKWERAGEGTPPR